MSDELALIQERAAHGSDSCPSDDAWLDAQRDRRWLLNDRKRLVDYSWEQVAEIDRLRGLLMDIRRDPQAAHWHEYIDALGTASQPSPVVCNWREDSDDAIWESDCGLSWVFAEGGPAENGVKWCCGCGKPLVVVPYVEPPVCVECGEELEGGKCPEGCTADNGEAGP